MRACRNAITLLLTVAGALGSGCNPGYTTASTPVSVTAAVTGTTGNQSTAVTWSVQESGGGTVDAQGHYVAPSSTGTYHVIATSVADASKKDTATVSVTATPVIAVSVSPRTISTL